MQLSIIIVSYNVAAFLEKCLQSVFKASAGVDQEIIVVDNCSIDQSVPLVKSKFPNVKLIVNQKNAGFSAANNQGIKIAQGRYILLLNPDTIVSEDCFVKCLKFANEQSNLGAIGVKMFDGSGKYLPESKRGFPSPWTSVSKMLRLNEIFPTSKLFNGYYQGHLNKDKTHEVDVLTGAFMWMPKDVLDEIGYLDESFFMYGEDIDLSYRIKNAGHAIYYYPDTSIIHYKGESTKKGSINYVRTFYNAMIIFAQKHFSGSQSWWMVIILKLGIYFAAAAKFISQKVNQLLPIVFDASMAGLSIYTASKIWAIYYYQNPDYFQPSFFKWNLPIYTFIWVVVFWIQGIYFRWTKISKYILSVIIGAAAILMMYALLPTDMRASRMVILLSAMLLLLMGIVARRLAKRFKGETLLKQGKKILLVGETMLVDRTKEVIARAAPRSEILGVIHTGSVADNTQYLNHVDQLEQVVNAYKPDEVIFSAKDISFSSITQWMTKLGGSMDYKIASDDSELIVGSASKNEAGEWYGMEMAFQIDSPIARRNKRIFDLLICLMMVLTLPILLLVARHWGRLMSNWFQVFIGRMTWFGYDHRDQKLDELPGLKMSVLHMQTGVIGRPTDSIIHNRNYLYAKDYTVWRDLDGVLKNIPRLSDHQIYKK